MADRLTRIYTRQGDKGTTQLANGQTVSKSSTRINAIGEVDQLNCQLGLLLTDLTEDHPLRATLTLCQHQLFDLGAELAVADAAYTPVEEAWISNTEQQIDQANQQLPPLKEFILPGGTPAAAHCHIARTLCRKAERTLVQLHQEEPEQLRAVCLRYLNRLSDLLFVFARLLARENGATEVLWQPVDKRM